MGDCLIGLAFMMEASTPFVSARAVLELLGEIQLGTLSEYWEIITPLAEGQWKLFRQRGALSRQRDNASQGQNNVARGQYNFQLARGQGCYNDIIVYKG